MQNVCIEFVHTATSFQLKDSRSREDIVKKFCYCLVTETPPNSIVLSATKRNENPKSARIKHLKERPMTIEWQSTIQNRNINTMFAQIFFTRIHDNVWINRCTAERIHKHKHKIHVQMQMQNFVGFFSLSRKKPASSFNVLCVRALQNDNNKPQTNGLT